MVTFGFLKFFNPIDGWFNVQIQQSHLPGRAQINGRTNTAVALPVALAFSFKSSNRSWRSGMNRESACGFLPPAISMTCSTTTLRKRLGP